MVDRAVADDLARFYDLDLADDPGDLDLYLAVAARTGGPVLELACGTGRLAVPLAQAGHDVVGVDHDEAMLGRARRRWDAVRGNARGTATRRGRGTRDAASGTLTLVTADVRDVDLEARFGLAFIALNTLLQLGSADDQRAAIAALARHVRPGGLVVADVWIPAPDDLALYDGRVVLEWIRDDPETGERVAKMASARYDAATRVAESRVTFDAWPPSGGPVRRVDRCDRLRLIDADELQRMAADAGLTVETLAGDHDLTPFGPGAARVVLVGRLL